MNVNIVYFNNFCCIKLQFMYYLNEYFQFFSYYNCIEGYDLLYVY